MKLSELDADKQPSRKHAKLLDLLIGRLLLGSGFVEGTDDLSHVRVGLRRVLSSVVALLETSASSRTNFLGIFVPRFETSDAE